jgi:hypothetical protein
MTRSLFRQLAAVPILFILLVAGACGDGDDVEPTGTAQPTEGDGELVAVITSSDLAVGPQRFAFVLLQDDNPVSAESIAVRFFKVKDESNPQLVGEGAIPFSPLGIPGLTTSGSELTGVYYANVTFDEAGKWGAGFTVGAQSDPEKEVRVAFEVKPEPSTVGVGEKAIAADNPTLADAPLEQIDTSSEPDEPFHELSISEALGNDKPSVIAFATPAFCETRTCGPTMEIVGAAYDKFGDKVNWVHVEPFKLDEDGDLLLSNGNKVNSDTANAWELPSEPWVFVVDKDGTVTGRFDGPLTLEEIDFHLTQLTSTP